MTQLTSLFRQLRNRIVSNLQIRITVWTGATVSILSFILIAYSVITLRQTAIADAQKEALAIAGAQAENIRGQFNLPLLTARTMADVLESLKDPSNTVTLDRGQVNAMLRTVLEENPSFLGTYTLWEPNAFDGLDATYAGTEAHDGTGRFIPYWVRGDDDSLHVEALKDYETPGVGDWYILPRQTRQSVTIAPLIYTIQGKPTLMASFVEPIIQEDKFYGIAGVDAPIAFVQDVVDGINLYNGTAKATLFSDTGTLIAVHKQPELSNQSATQIYADFDQLKNQLTAGEPFVSRSPDGSSLRVFAPINVGESGTHWYFGLVIPFSQITSAATTAAIRQVVINLVLMALALTALWFLTGRVVRPLQSLTNVATAITQGNLALSAEVKSTDEIGVLARAFNLMLSQVRESLSTLESRVAERTQSLEMAAQVGRAVSQVRTLDVMLKDAAEIIRSRFDLYYVQVYLTDASFTNLVLRSGTGEVGAQLVGRGHHLALNINSINGRAAIEKHSVVVADTAASPTFRPNPLLPETRSEMAIPLLVGEKVVGVLDLQSRTANALNQDLLPAFEALAGQLAIAIHNANLLTETEQARAEVEKQAQRLVRIGWQDYMDAVHKPEFTGYVFEGNQIVPLHEQPAETDAAALTAPIAIGGEKLGAFSVEMEATNKSAYAADLLNTVARQVAQQIENLRLLESAERYRSEVEQSIRRQTREGWQEYVSRSSETLSYLYDAKEVKPADQETIPGEAEATVSLPLKVREETIGKLAILDMTPDDDEALSLANEVASRLGAHLESLRLFEQTQVSLAEAQSLYRINEAISGEMELEAIYQTVARLSCNEMGFSGAWIAVYDPETESLRGVAGINMPDERIFTRLPLDQKTPANLAAQTRQLVRVNDPRQDERMVDIPLDMRAVMGKALSVPVMIGQELLGVISVTRSETAADIGVREERMLQAVATQLAIVMQRIKLFEQLQKQAKREATLNAISQKIQSATSVEAVLQIAARELGHALGAPRTIAQLSMKDKN